MKLQRSPLIFLIAFSVTKIDFGIFVWVICQESSRIKPRKLEMLGWKKASVCLCLFCFCVSPCLPLGSTDCEVNKRKRRWQIGKILWLRLMRFHKSTRMQVEKEPILTYNSIFWVWICVTDWITIHDPAVTDCLTDVVTSSGRAQINHKWNIQIQNYVIFHFLGFTVKKKGQNENDGFQIILCCFAELCQPRFPKNDQVNITSVCLSLLLVS